MIKGPQVFLEYWNRTSESKDSFFEGWFKSCDIAFLSNVYYILLGWVSVFIISVLAKPGTPSKKTCPSESRAKIRLEIN